MSAEALADILRVPAAAIAVADEQLRTGLTTKGGAGAPVSALRILNLYLQRLGCEFQVTRLPSCSRHRPRRRWTFYVFCSDTLRSAHGSCPHQGLAIASDVCLVHCEMPLCAILHGLNSWSELTRQLS